MSALLGYLVIGGEKTPNNSKKALHSKGNVGNPSKSCRGLQLLSAISCDPSPSLFPCPLGFHEHSCACLPFSPGGINRIPLYLGRGQWGLECGYLVCVTVFWQALCSIYTRITHRAPWSGFWVFFVRTVELERQWEAQVFLFIASIPALCSWGKDRGVLGAALVLIFLVVMEWLTIYGNGVFSSHFFIFKAWFMLMLPVQKIEAVDGHRKSHQVLPPQQPWLKWK